jgi:hypothetical protein
MVHLTESKIRIRLVLLTIFRISVNMAVLGIGAKESNTENIVAVISQRYSWQKVKSKQGWRC